MLSKSAAHFNKQILLLLFLCFLSILSHAQESTETATEEAVSYEEAVLHAQNFTGTLNSDWQPYEHEFDDEVTMALVPTGCFQMGLNNSGGDQCIEAFWIDLTEVSQGDFERLGGEKAIANQYAGADLPVDSITWYEARDYCESLDKRLPTEAEWEYAARGVENWIFPWGNDWDRSRANYCDSNCELNFRDRNVDDGYRNSAPVGSYPQGASWIGALDMAGNVLEWTSTVYFDLPYDPNDGRESPENESHPHVLHNGGWNNQFDYLRTMDRLFFEPDETLQVIGFRCARNIDN